MASQVTNYQCPSCSGPLHFDGATGQLKCDYCRSSYEVAEIEALYAEKDAKAAAAKKAEEEAAREAASAATAPDGTEAAPEGAAAASSDGAETASEDAQTEDTSEWDTSELQSDWGSDAEGMKIYSCPSCGAEIICDATTAATSCPYCRNVSIVPGQFADELKPDYVIPFKLSKQDAVNALKKHYGKKPLLPKAFSDANHIAEVKGVYVPFWMFDGVAEGSVTFEATRSHSHRSKGYEITETDHFDVKRSGELAFENVPVDASSKMLDDYMDSIEPFDYSELKPFSTAYLPGFLADKYDVSAQDSFERADERCKGSFEAAMAKTVIGYNSCTTKAADIRLRRGKVHYALLPVWVLNTNWDGKDFLFIMNGQTGKLVGALPASFKRAVALFLAIAAVLIALGSAFALYLLS